MAITTQVGQPTREAVLVGVAGDVDSADKHELLDALVACGLPHTRTVVLDLAEVTYMGSSGLTALLAAREQLLHLGIQLRVDHCSPMVTRVLEITALGPHFPRSRDVLPLD